MSFINSFISDFVKRGGVSILLSTALVKFSSTILSIIIVRLLSKAEYGELSFILSIYSIAIVIAGCGGNFSLLRYGSITKSYSERKSYYNYTLVNGLKNVFIVGLILCILPFIIDKKGDIIYYILVTLSLFPYYALEVLRSYLRIINLNRLYSKLNIWNSLSLLIFAIVLTYCWGINGYLIALILSSMIVFLLYNNRLKIFNKRKVFISFNKKDYWTYGLHTSISAIINQIVFSVAPFLLGILGASEYNIAKFKVATIIPFALLTLPGILMVTDFSYVSRNYMSPDIIRRYYRNYIKTIIPISFIVFTILIVFAEWVIEFFFGSQYLDCVDMYRLFMIATFITYIFRNPLGNILLAVGKAHWNGYNAYCSCAVYIISSVICYKFIGIWGIVYSLCATFILSGFVSLFFYKRYIKSLTSHT